MSCVDTVVQHVRWRNRAYLAHVDKSRKKKEAAISLGVVTGDLDAE